MNDKNKTRTFYHDKKPRQFSTARILPFSAQPIPVIVDTLGSVIARVRKSGVGKMFYFKPYLQKESHVGSFSLTPVPFSDPLSHVKSAVIGQISGRYSTVLPARI